MPAIVLFCTTDQFAGRLDAGWKFAAIEPAVAKVASKLPAPAPALAHTSASRLPFWSMCTSCRSTGDCPAPAGSPLPVALTVTPLSRA